MVAEATALQRENVPRHILFTIACGILRAKSLRPFLNMQENSWHPSCRTGCRFFDRKICKAQQLFGVSNAQGQKVSVDGDAELFPENPGQVKFVDIKSFRKVVEPDCFRIMEIQVIFDLLQVIFAGGRFGGAPGCQLSCISKESRAVSCSKSSYRGHNRRKPPFHRGCQEFSDTGQGFGGESRQDRRARYIFIDSGHVRAIKSAPIQVSKADWSSGGGSSYYSPETHSPRQRVCSASGRIRESRSLQDNKTQVGGEIFPVAGVGDSAFKRPHSCRWMRFVRAKVDGVYKIRSDSTSSFKRAVSIKKFSCRFFNQSSSF